MKFLSLFTWFKKKPKPEAKSSEELLFGPTARPMYQKPPAPPATLDYRIQSQAQPTLLVQNPAPLGLDPVDYLIVELILQNRQSESPAPAPAPFESGEGGNFGGGGATASWSSSDSYSSSSSDSSSSDSSSSDSSSCSSSD